MVGMPDMANVCLAKLVTAGIRVAGLVPPHRSNPSFQSMIQSANSFNVPVFPFANTPNEPQLIRQLSAIDADIGVICSYDIKLSRDFLKTTKMGYINCHPSMLPKYRGANPYHHIIKSGDTMTGVTLHFADQNFDTGEIILQKEIPIEPNETMGTLFNRSNFLIADALIYVLKNFEVSGEIPSRKQEKGKFPTAPRVPTNVVIDFKKDVVEIERLVRACNPFYNAILFFRGTMFKIASTDIRVEEHNYTYGEITKIANGLAPEELRSTSQSNGCACGSTHGSRLEIAMKGGFLIPKIVQVGTWGIFSVGSFIEKFAPQVGERLINE